MQGTRRATCTPCGSWVNARTESLWGSLNVGRLCGKQFAIQWEAIDAIIDWLTFYAHRRLHSMLGDVSPMKFDSTWHADHAKKARYPSILSMGHGGHGQGHHPVLAHIGGLRSFSAIGAVITEPMTTTTWSEGYPSPSRADTITG